MFCHVPHVLDLYPITVSGIAPSLPSGGSIFHPAASTFRFRHRVLLPSSSSFRSPRNRPASGGTLIRAYPARALVPVRARVGAGAVRAPDCAHEAEGARLPQVSQGFFRAGAGMGGSSLRTPLPILILALFYHTFQKRKPCADNFSCFPAIKLIMKENFLTSAQSRPVTPAPGAAPPRSGEARVRSRHQTRPRETKSRSATDGPAACGQMTSG